MQMPMEILSLMMTRTDFGADSRQKTPATTKPDREFGNVLQESRSEMDKEKVKNDGAASETKPAAKDPKPPPPEKPEKPNKPEGIADEDGEIAAGAMGYQNSVVFILEGDKESATTPEIAVDAAPQVDADIAIDTAEAPPETERNAVETRPEKPEADAKAEPDKLASDTGIGADAISAKDVKASEGANKANATEAANEESGKAGEVTARMPAIRTSEKQENQDNKDNGAGFSKNGDLGPLENENETKPLEGQKEKTYTEAEKTAKDKQEAVNEPLDNALPITESIKPERFQANQQMKQAESAPVRAENLFDEMVSRIETMHTENQQSVTIQLKPEMLGKLALEIAMDAAGLHVKISAADSDVRTMINGQINALIESLENKGIEVVEVEVAYTGVDNGAFKDSQNNQAQSGHPKRSRRADGIDDGAAYYAVFPQEALDYYLDEELSSVEYRA